MDDLKLYAKNEKGLDSLAQTVRIFSDIGMEFVIDKCAILAVKRGKIAKFDGISFPSGKVMKGLIEGAGYRYLGIMQADQILYTEMKEKVKTEYLRRVRKVLETKLNGGNIIKGINIWASLLRYSAAFIDWNCTELTQLDRRTRKLMTMHNALHPKSNVDRLYIPRRKEGGRGLQGVEETVKVTNLGLENYVKESREHLLTAARSVDIDLIEPIRETTIKAKTQKKERRTISWEKKMLHGQFVQQTMEVGDRDSCQWLRNGTLKRETETLIFAAQEQAIRTDVSFSKTLLTTERRLTGW